MTRYETLVEAYYSDGSKTEVKFYMHNYSEFHITYTDYTANNKRSRAKNQIMPREATTVHQLFAYAHAAIAGYRFAKWYYTKYENALAMPHFPEVVWHMDEE